MYSSLRVAYLMSRAKIKAAGKVDNTATTLPKHLKSVIVGSGKTRLVISAMNRDCSKCSRRGIKMKNSFTGRLSGDYKILPYKRREGRRLRSSRPKLKAKTG
jgi:hypothetical protein